MENEKTQEAEMFNFDFTLIAQYFKGLNRQGPGSNEETRRALQFIPPLAEQARIADIGCGTGQQTAVLAQSCKGHITAVDLLPEMIDGVCERMEREGLADRVTPLQASMEELPFEKESFDLFWAEGSIYHMGYEKGLHAWHPFIKPGGYLALTECCWLGNARTTDSWLTDNFMEIDTIAAKLSILQDCGYQPVAHFVLPESCWTEEYYAPMPARMETFLKEHPGNPSAQMLVQSLKEEIAYYQKNKSYYGYVFFIAKKIN